MSMSGRRRVAAGNRNPGRLLAGGRVVQGDRQESRELPRRRERLAVGRHRDAHAVDSAAVDGP